MRIYYKGGGERVKTREELLTQAFLNRSEISKLLCVPYKAASKIYEMADKIDQECLKEFRIYDTKVRITSVCKVAGISLNTLQKQIKST